MKALVFTMFLALAPVASAFDPMAQEHEAACEAEGCGGSALPWLTPLFLLGVIAYGVCKGSKV